MQLSVSGASCPQAGEVPVAEALRTDPYTGFSPRCRIYACSAGFPFPRKRRFLRALQ